ncbi:MAG TPA: ornithine carbamoyltransferase [Bacteroidota bacterium]|nr:ornithine carbamoyltransferase [Bacteroidota bacterium]
MKKDFISIAELTRTDVHEILALTDTLKSDPTIKPLAGKTVATIFQKPSLRTRVSFEVGIVQLGGHPVYLGNESIGMGSRESVADIANMLTRFCDAIVARVYQHEIIVELAKHSTVPVINALTDLSHPCQIMSDAYTLRQHGKLRDGVKIAYIGDGNNIVNSWLELSMLLPLHLSLAVPVGYEPDRTILDAAKNAGVSTIELVHSPAEAAKDADVIYSDTWVSMGQEQDKIRRMYDFWEYQVNATLLKRAKDDVIVMHCLPAHRGEEITDEVLDGSHSVVYDQGENRLHVQKALLTKLVAPQRRSHE